MKIDALFRRFNIGLLSFCLLFFVLLPLLLLALASIQPPRGISLTVVSFNQYKELMDPIYLLVFLRSIFIAALSSFCCLLIAYPIAYLLTRIHLRWRGWLLLLLMIPFWLNSLIRTYAIMTIIKAKGLLNILLLTLHLAPLDLLFSRTAVVIGLVYNLIPFMILPLYASFSRLDKQLIEAAKDLGASPSRILFDIIIPQTTSGIAAGLMLVFLPAMTLFYIPNLLGGARSMLLGNVIENKFLSVGGWPMGAALSMCLMLLMLVFSYFFKRMKGRAEDLL